MTRKDYELIAGAINDVRKSALRNVRDADSIAARLDAIDGIAYRLASDLAGTNPRFDAGRFVRACTEE